MAPRDEVLPWVTDHASALPVKLVQGSGTSWLGEGEALWLPVLGPSACAAASALIRRCLLRPDRKLTVDLAELGPAVGLSAMLGRNAPVVKAVSRLARFGPAYILNNELLVEERVPAPRNRGVRIGE